MTGCGSWGQGLLAQWTAGMDHTRKRSCPSRGCFQQLATSVLKLAAKRRAGGGCSTL